MRGVPTNSRILSFVVLAMWFWHGCASLVVADITGHHNRHRLAEATGTAAELIEHAPARGDTLHVWLADGRKVYGPFDRVTTDSVYLSQPGGIVAFGLGEVEEVRRPWRESSNHIALFAGVVVDLAFYYLVLRRGVYGL